jgi:GNAT superfamily N-acetyltransferase
MPITSRPYADESDDAHMRALLHTIVALRGVPAYCTVSDLDWGRFTDEDPHAVRTAQLWLDNDDVVGIAWPDGMRVDLMTHPDHRALENEMLQWAEEQSRNDADAANSFHAWSFEHDAWRIAMLQQRGYTRNDKHFVWRARSLDGNLPMPTLPNGFTLRHVAGEADIEQRVEVHRAAFAPSRMTVAKHRAVMSAPTYRFDLDLIAVVPDGRFAAYCIVWLDEANRVGVFEPVGCHPDFQRRGLAKVVMRRAATVAGARRSHRVRAQLARRDCACQALRRARISRAWSQLPVYEAGVGKIICQ